MQVKVPVPYWLTRRVGDWLNAVVWRRGIEVRVVDILVLVGFILCVTWYWLVYSWKTALLSALVYVFFAMAALWL